MLNCVLKRKAFSEKFVPRSQSIAVMSSRSRKSHSYSASLLLNDPVTSVCPCTSSESPLSAAPNSVPTGAPSRTS